MPKIDERFISKLEEMIDDHRELGRKRNDVGQLLRSEDRAACVGWITSAATAVENICPPESAYRRTVEHLVEAAHSKNGLMVYEFVLQISEVLRQLVRDAKAGLLVNEESARNTQLPNPEIKLDALNIRPSKKPVSDTS